jgi:hypothetical protein
MTGGGESAEETAAKAVAEEATTIKVAEEASAMTRLRWPW